MHGREESRRRQTTKLSWNSESQLIASSTERTNTSPQHTRYHYDAIGRRIGKSDAFGTTWFVWDGMRMVHEERGDKVITTVYEDQGSYVPLARIEHGKHQASLNTS